MPPHESCNAANSGQYLATDAYTSNSPRSTSTSAASAVIVLVTDQVAVTVSSPMASHAQCQPIRPTDRPGKTIPNDGYRGIQVFPGIQVLLQQITER